MPVNNKLEPKKLQFPIQLGQIPLTRFKDYRKSIDVRMTRWDDRKASMLGVYKFIKSTWAQSPRDTDNPTEEEMADAFKQMLEGKTMPLALETIHVEFEIGGITHIDAQQITRQRIGVTFAAQCSGDQWWSHHDCLVEESIAKDPELLEAFIKSTLDAKMCYAKMTDNGISIQAARSILPRNLETFYYMNTNLATLLFFYQKRIDDGSQTWQMNVIAQQMADEVCKVYPEMIPVFEKAKSKFKFQKETGEDRKATFSTNLYFPKKDEYEYAERDSLYQSTKEQMHFTNTPMKDRYFFGLEEVDDIIFDALKKDFADWDSVVKRNNWSNEEIKKKTQELMKSHQDLQRLKY